MIKKYLTKLSAAAVDRLFVQPDNVGKNMTDPSACPNSPNCVSTKATDEKHHIENMKYTCTLEDVNQRIVEIINSMERTEIVILKPNYIYVKFTTKSLHFIDDVEFFFDDNLKVIDFRSASRVGYSDMGQNRKRMEEIRKKFYS